MTERKNVVVVGVDESDSAAAAALWGAALAHRKGASLKLIHAFVVQVDTAFGTGNTIVDEFDAARAAGEKVLVDLQAEIERRFPHLTVEVSLRNAPPAEVMLEATAEAEITVLGSTRKSRLGALFLGSVATHAAEHGHGPVIVLRGEAPSTPVGGPVVIGIDPANPSEPALDFAFGLAESLKLQVVALTSWDDVKVKSFLQAVPIVPDEQALIDHQRTELLEVLASWTAAHPDVDVRTVVATGRPVDAVLAVADQCDASMVIVGARGRGNVSGLLLGSVSRDVLHHSPRPVAVVPNHL